jgi:hypothetical protein
MATIRVASILAAFLVAAICHAAPPDAEKSGRPDEVGGPERDGSSDAVSASENIVKPDPSLLGEPKQHKVQLIPEFKALQDKLEKIRLPEPVNKKLGEILPVNPTHDPVKLSPATASALILGLAVELPKIEQKLSEISQSYEIGIRTIKKEIEWSDGTFEVNIQVDFGSIQDLDISTMGPVEIIGAGVTLKMPF